MNSDQTFVVVVDGAIRRLSLDNLQNIMGNNIFYPSITLEQSSNPAFTLPTPFMAQMYQKAMGGYMMKVVNGKVYAAKLNPDNWEYFADGTAVDDASKYETMVHVPHCHFKADGQTLQFGGLFPIANGHTFDSPQWVGAYKMYVDGSNIGHSRPGVAPAHSKTMSAFHACAKNRGSNFGLANYGFHCLINALYQVSYGNLDSQTTIGAGFQLSSWEACRDVPMGKCVQLGDGSGKVLYNDSTLGDQYPIKLFGFEDLWGKLWEFRPGIRFYMQDSVRYAVVYSGNQVSNTATGRSFVCPVQSASGSYIKTMTLSEYWDMIPSAVGGSASTYYADGYWAATGGELLLVGGCASDRSLCGLSYAGSHCGFSYSWALIGARLAFYGTPELVSGSELVAM